MTTAKEYMRGLLNALDDQLAELIEERARTVHHPDDQMALYYNGLIDGLDKARCIAESLLEVL